MEASEIELAWQEVLKDLGDHRVRDRLELSVDVLQLTDPEAVGMTARDFEDEPVVARLSLDGVVARGALFTRVDVLPYVMAGLADLLQDVVEEEGHDSWPRCATHHRSALPMVVEHVAVWRCSSGDWTARIGDLDGGSVARSAAD